jgi:hypothetical protein
MHLHWSIPTKLSGQSAGQVSVTGLFTSTDEGKTGTGKLCKLDPVQSDGKSLYKPFHSW